MNWKAFYEVSLISLIAIFLGVWLAADPILSLTGLLIILSGLVVFAVGLMAAYRS
jgi:hypothetical protein